MESVRWGIIGCGDVTEVKSGPAFQKAHHSKLVAVMRRNGNLAADYARRHGVPKWYDDASKLIADPEVDAVYVATPPGAHLEIALMCAKAGKPALVEKPMARNFAECRTMIRAFAGAGVSLFVAYYRRSLPRFLKVKELIDSGSIGRVLGVTTELYAPPLATPGWHAHAGISGGGRFVDSASHTLDFLDFVLGPVRAVRGFSVGPDAPDAVEDTVWGAFEYESGVKAVGIWRFTDAIDVDRTVVQGTKGKVMFSSFGTDPIQIRTSDYTRELSIEHPDHVHLPLIEAVVDELTGNGKCPSTGESGSRTSRVMDELLIDFKKTHTGYVP